MGRPENAVKNRWNSLMNRKWTQSLQAQNRARDIRNGGTGRGNFNSWMMVVSFASIGEDTNFMDMFSSDSPFVQAVQGDGSIVESNTNALAANAVPALGATHVQFSTSEERNLLHNVYRTLGKSVGMPNVPPTPNVQGAWGGRTPKGQNYSTMLRNSNSAWDKSSSSSDSKTESSDLAAPGSNNRVLEMTSTFLRMEVQRKNMFESVRAASKMAKVDNNNRNQLMQAQIRQQQEVASYRPSRSPIGLSAATPLDDFSFSFETEGYNLDTPKVGGTSSSSSSNNNNNNGGATQWATGGQSNVMMPSKGGEMSITPTTASTGLGARLQQRRQDNASSLLRQSMEGINNMSIESNSFGTTSAKMPARTAPPSLALGNASQQFLFDGSNMGLMLSPAAEQLAKISMLFKSGGISSEQRSQMKDHLYMSLSQDSLL